VGEPSETVVVQDLRTDERQTLTLEAFERALAQGEAAWPV
jgi:hypothetical protein